MNIKIAVLCSLHSFREHPYEVRDDAEMAGLVESIKEQRVMASATVRPEKDGNRYEVIAVHHLHGSELAGAAEIPCIARNLTDMKAVKLMKNSNKQRGEPLTSELARPLDLEQETINRPGKSSLDSVIV